MDAITAIRERRSIRTYKNAPIPKEDLETILDCGRCAPCGMNKQAWKFVAVTDEKRRNDIADVLPYGQFIRQAHACVLVFVHGSSRTDVEDGAAAATSMMIAAKALGYGTCWISGYREPNSSAVHKVMNAPDDWKLTVIFALGVPDEEPARDKKPLDQVVCYNELKV